MDALLRAGEPAEPPREETGWFLYDRASENVLGEYLTEAAAYAQREAFDLLNPGHRGDLEILQFVPVSSPAPAEPPERQT
jgi:hypothetical protein